MYSVRRLYLNCIPKKGTFLPAQLMWSLCGVVVGLRMKTIGNEMLQLHFEYLKVKSEDWGGEFVDLQPGEDVPNRSVLRAIVENSPQPLVSCFILTKLVNE